MSPRAPERPTIWVCGEPIEVPGDVKVVTFKESTAWSFYAAREVNREARFLYPRFDAEGRPITELTRLKDAVQRIVLHTDVARTAADCFRFLVEQGFSTHFIVDWDGTIYQCADPQDTAIHAGPANKTSIGIDLNNVLPNLAQRGYSSVTYPTDIDPGIQDPTSPYYRPLYKPMIINGIKTRSYGYCDKQYEGLLALLKALLKVLPSIPPYPPVDESGQVVPRVLDDFMGFSGIMGHWHISTTRWDPGPLDWDRVVAGLSEEHNSFPFLMADRGNIATLMARDKVEKRANDYYANNEQGFGGYYPIGLSQNWHNGIHLHAEEGTEILNMIDGTLVAAHVLRTPTDLGSNSFVLLRHDIDLPRISSKGKPIRVRLVVYSLYMHLAPFSVEEDDEAPPWVRHAYRLDRGEADEGDEPSLGKTSKGKDEDEDEDDDEERLAFERRARATPVLEVGKGLWALKRGQVALFPLDPERRIRVPANERLGRMGSFGEESDREPLLHVEVFADHRWREGIDMNRHGDFWVELDEDLRNDLVVDTEEILRLFVSDRRRLGRRRNAEVTVRASEIEDFFSDPDSGAKSYLRRAIVRHISEWSSAVNWVRSLTRGQGWDALLDLADQYTDADDLALNGYFVSEIRARLPFVWLTEAVAEHAGLEIEEGIVYTFHPIYFLMWLTFRSAQRIQVLSSGKSEKDLKEAYRREMQRYDEQRKQRLLDENAENIAEGSIAWDLDAVEASPDEVLEDLKGLRFPDRWRTDEEDDE